jgi:hypothetical protein
MLIQKREEFVNSQPMFKKDCGPGQTIRGRLGRSVKDISLIGPRVLCRLIIQKIANDRSRPRQEQKTDTAALRQ